MSFIQFESGREKDRIRQDIREARDKLLQKAEADFERRKEFDIQKQLRGDDQWINPAVERKLKENSSEISSKKSHKKKSKKEKHKKHKKEKKSKKNRHSSENDSSTSASEDEWVEKSTVSTKNKSNTKLSPAPSSPPPQQKRDDWMSSADFGSSIPLFSKEKSNKKDEPRADLNSYDPKTSSRELNPYWKESGTGLPSATATTSSTGGINKSMFKKPKANYSDDDDDDDNFYRNKKYSASQRPSSSSSSQNWKKLEHRTTEQSMKTARLTEMNSDSSGSSTHSKSPSPPPPLSSLSSSSKPPPTPTQQDFLTDQQMNELGAKLIKAEIMGNIELSTELKVKLDKAREYRENHKQEMLSKVKSSTNRENNGSKSNNDSENILLTETNTMGMSRPMKKTSTKQSASFVASSEPWGGRRGAKNNKKSKSQSSFSLDGERLRYFPDDDKYDIKTMFENEKYTTAQDQDRQFVEATASGGGGKRIESNDDDFADIFMDKMSRKRHQTDDEHDYRAKQQAIEQHKRIEKSLETCDKCFDSIKFEKQLIIAMGTNVYLTLPWHEGIQPGHCLIIPQSHVSCATQLDEDVWLEVQQFQQALVNMFRSRGQDCVFFETARYLHRRPHCVIQCVPNRDFEMAPFYFKKAIQESEREWSTNKQLVILKEKSLRQSIPKGLPYFWVQCGRDIGFAHVIEEQERFPAHFAQEILAGLLNLDARVYRRPRKEQQSIAKVKQFSDWWKPFDITTNEGT